MLFSVKVACVSLAGSSTIEDKFYLNLQRNIMSLYESASVSADIITTLGSFFYVHRDYESSKILKEEAEIEST